MKKYEEIASKIEEAVEKGTLSDGDRIPSIRSMSAGTGYSVMTVQEGYRVLLDRGLLESRPKSGYFVRPAYLRAPPLPASSLSIPQTEEIKSSRFSVDISDALEELLSSASRTDLVPLGAGLPDPVLLPSESLSMSLARIVRRHPERSNSYCLGAGCEELRREIARLMLSQGIEASPSKILVTGGATQALLTILRASVKEGGTVAVESPGYYGFYSLCAYLRLKVVEVPSNPSTGLSVSAFEEATAKHPQISALLVSPTHSNPTGGCIPKDAQEHLVRLCEKREITIIEDDTYGNLRFEGERPTPMASTRSRNVMHVGSFSKVLAPGYRIAWVSGEGLGLDMVRTHSTGAMAVATPNQMAVASFLKNRGFKRHMVTFSRHVQHTMIRLRNCIADSFPSNTAVTEPAGGQFLWVCLPKGADSRVLCRKCLEKGISIAPGVLFSAKENYKNHLRLNCALPWSKQLETSIRVVGELMKPEPKGSVPSY